MRKNPSKDLKNKSKPVDIGHQDTSKEKDTKQIDDKLNEAEDEEEDEWDEEGNGEFDEFYDEADEYEIELVDYKKKIPPVSLNVIDSFDCLQKLSKKEQEFYRIYKKMFYDGEVLDLKGNDQYAYLLIYDLLLELDTDVFDITVIDILEDISTAYPSLNDFCEELIAGINDNVKQRKAYFDKFIKDFQKSRNGIYCGNAYKSKMKLIKKEVLLLNNIYAPNEKIFELDELKISLFRVYLTIIDEIDLDFQNKKMNLEIEFAKIANALKAHLDTNYQFFLEFLEKEIYRAIFLICKKEFFDQIGVRYKFTYWNYYQKANDVNQWLDENVFSFAQSRISSMVAKALETNDLLENVYKKGPTLWKNRLINISQSNEINSILYLEEILKLGRYINFLPDKCALYHDATKLIVSKDQRVAFILYLSYYHCWLENEKIKSTDKKPNKKILKKYFTNKAQEQAFDSIILTLEKDKNLEAASQAVDILFGFKRKQIVLNNENITAVQNQHSGTVSLLNAYLQDESELPAPTAKVAVPIQPKPVENTEIIGSRYLKELKLSEAHVKTLDYFKANQYHVLKTELEIFCKGLSQFTPTFPNKLIENINDICFETLDDLLIEETDGTFTVSETYFAKIENL